MAPELLATRSPAVANTLIEPFMPLYTIHWTAVSDTHSDASQEVDASLVLSVIAKLCKLPIELPLIVTLALPVEARLVGPQEDATIGRSNDKICVPLPTRWPAVSITCLVPCAPRATMLTTDVSDCQKDASHSVSPVLTRSVNALKLTPDPTTVIVEDASGRAPGVLLTYSVEITDASYEWISLLDPDICPPVTDTRRVERKPCATIPCTEESETHCEDSQRVAPDRIIDVYMDSPRSKPISVTCDIPEAPRLLYTRV